MEGENPKGAGSGGGKGGENCSRDGLMLVSRELTDAQSPARHPDSHGFPGQKRNTPPMLELVLLRHQTGLQQVVYPKCLEQSLLKKTMRGSGVNSPSDLNDISSLNHCPWL